MEVGLCLAEKTQIVEVVTAELEGELADPTTSKGHMAGCD